MVWLQPYHDSPLQGSDRGDLPSSEQIRRVLAPHQTVQERNISARRPGWPPPVWMRTCYAPELDAAHSELISYVDIESDTEVDAQGVLDDANLYDFGPDWSRILVRIPELCDVLRGSVEDDYVRCIRQEGEAEDEMDLIDIRAVTRLYIADDQALREGRVKIFWLDSHGNCVWHNKIKPSSLMEFTGAMFDAPTLCDALSWAEGDPEGSKFEKGAELLFP